MVVRVGSSVPVTGEQLAAAIAIVTGVCERYGVTPSVAVGPYNDPDSGDGPVTMIWAELPSQPALPFYDMAWELAEELRAAHLSPPEVPLRGHLVPGW